MMKFQLSVIRTHFLLLIFFIACLPTHAQVYHERIGFERESIANIDIGWIRIATFTTPPVAKTAGTRSYSARQIENSQKFIEWMQQTYYPRGVLGDVGYYQNKIYQFSNTNSVIGNLNASIVDALPLMYGAYSKLYQFLKKDAQGKFVPQNDLSEYWRIEANHLQYISQPVSFISTPQAYYFTMPQYFKGVKGVLEQGAKCATAQGFDTHPNLQPYQHFYIPPKIIDDYGYYVVIMTRDNQPLPFEKVTIGEFFELSEKSITAWYEKVINKNDNPALREKELATARKNLARLKEKYKSRWNEVATLKVNTQVTYTDFVNAIEGNYDWFDRKDPEGKEFQNSYFPILRVKKEAMDACKTDQPQWLVMRWSDDVTFGSSWVYRAETILNKFNFRYMYDYFYGKAKPGAPYKPN